MNAVRAAALILFAALGTPVLAQTPSIPGTVTSADRTQLAGCLSRSGAALSSCIGSVAVACVQAAGPNRRDLEFSCARREEAVWRERLNRALQIIGRPLDAGQRSRFVALQIAWEGYVAQKCAFYRSTQPATLQMGRQAGCELREVAERALELQKALPRQPQRRPQSPPRIIR